MKNMKKLLIAASIVLGFTASSFAQVTATATASANIITPITIEKTTDMDFGNVAVSPVTAGTVQMSTSSVRTAGGGVTLPAVSGTVAAAQFTVQGLAGSTYSISLPNSSVSLSDGATHTMIVDNFITLPTPTGVLNASGSQVISVGGTLNVDAAQAAGLYSNTTDLQVTVNYN
jgi:hypothetical protein